MSTVVLLLGLLLSADPSPGLQIRPGADPTQVQVDATLPADVTAKLPEGKVEADDGERWLRLGRVDEASGEVGSPILGRYERRGNTLVFQPRYGLVHGSLYRAECSAPGVETQRSDYRVPPRKPTPPTVVDAIYPTADELPANLLKFYIHFSQPMREGRDIFDRIQLINDKGQPVESPWRNTELWTLDATRLTLWIHPGRVKAGVNLRDDIGPVLEAGHKYTLVVSADTLDGVGQPLGREYRKAFTVVGDDHQQPLLRTWTITPPALGTSEPLVVAFPKPLDRHLLMRYLEVRDSQGTPVAGKIEVGKLERTWSFVPEQTWKKQTYTLVADERLEDLAGNTPARPFEVDLDAPPPTTPQLGKSFRPAEK